MYIVTCDDGRERSGCLIAFATQISVDPPRYVIGISRENHTHGVIRGASHVAVHVLTRDDCDLARLFGGRSGDRIDKFDRCRWHRGPDRVPLLDDCPRWFVGRIVDRLEGGDHTLHVIEVVEASCERDGPRLTYQQVKDLPPGHPLDD
jgi:flavin reductase (DIM6/NTAB) family NADH-FMN oxidoreductase RutF